MAEACLRWKARVAKINNAEYFGSAQEHAKLVGSWPALDNIPHINGRLETVSGLALPVQNLTNRMGLTLAYNDL